MMQQTCQHSNYFSAYIRSLTDILHCFIHIQVSFNKQSFDSGNTLTGCCNCADCAYCADFAGCSSNGCCYTDQCLDTNCCLFWDGLGGLDEFGVLGVLGNDRMVA